MNYPLLAFQVVVYTLAAIGLLHALGAVRDRVREIAAMVREARARKAGVR